MNIRIEKYDNEGRGIGYYNKKIVFVPNSIVGEIVDVDLILEKNNYYVARLKNVLNPSSIRVSPACPYFNKCGGCSFQHVSIDEEKRIKTSFVKDVLKKYAEVDIDFDYININNYYNYRNKITLKIVDGKFGYYNSDSHEFIEIKSCAIAKKSINNLLKEKDCFKIKNGELVIRSNYNDELLIGIKTDDEYFIDCNRIAINNKLVGVIVNGKKIYGDTDFIEKIGNYLFKVNINSFFQVNIEILEKVFNYLGNRKFDNLVDLYCGVGTLGIACKKNKLYGIEVIEDAVKNAIVNARINKQNNNMYMLGDSSNISKIKDSIDSIIIDPPRSGLSKSTIKNIVNIKPKYIVYMSCNLITFARDLKILKNIYNVTDFHVLEMFPRTKHVEILCFLERK